MPKSFLVKRILSDETDTDGGVAIDSKVKQEYLYQHPRDSYFGEKEPDEKTTSSHGMRCYYDECRERYQDQLRLLNHYFLYLQANDFKMKDRLYVDADTKIQKHIQENTTKKQQKLYSCKVCSKTFDRSSSLSNHMLIHNNSKSFKCKKCDLCFLRKSDLSKHEVIHSGEKPYKCQTCGKRFSQSSNMLTHQRRHTGIRPFACKICGKSFYRKVDVRRHHLIHRN